MLTALRCSDPLVLRCSRTTDNIETPTTDNQNEDRPKTTGKLLTNLSTESDQAHRAAHGIYEGEAKAILQALRDQHFGARQREEITAEVTAQFSIGRLDPVKREVIKVRANFG